MLRSFTRTAALLLVVCSGMVGMSGCGAGALSKLLPFPIPSPTPTPIVNVAPSSLTLSLATKKTATVTASESSGSGFFTAQTSDATKATVAPVPGSSNVFTVTAVAIGSCTIVVSDGQGGSTNVSITVGS